MVQNSTTQIFGEFPAEIPASDEFLTLNFSPSSAPRKHRWINYGLSADFLGDYFAAFFPGDSIPDSQINLKDTVKAAVSYIANELLENAVKYSEDSVNLPISISLHLYDREIIFHVVNHANLTVVASYQEFIRETLSADLDSLYTRQLEKTAMGLGGSSMGVLTMMNDYAARFGWKFEPLEPSTAAVKVQTLVHLSLLG